MKNLKPKVLLIVAALALSAGCSDKHDEEVAARKERMIALRHAHERRCALIKGGVEAGYFAANSGIKYSDFILTLDSKLDQVWLDVLEAEQKTYVPTK